MSGHYSGGGEGQMVRKEVVEEAVIVVGLVAAQVAYAGNSVLMGYVMSFGVDPLTLILFASLSTFFFLSPLALCFERSLWPKTLTLKLMIQLVLISFGGVTLFQTLFLKGIKLTSPAMATAMPNLAPGLIFIIAWTVGLERVNWSLLYSKIKIVGTVLCVAGAVTMSLMHSAAAKGSASYLVFDKQKIIGSSYLLGAVFMMSSIVVLQAATLGDFPAPISLSAVTSLIGVFTTIAAQLFEGRIVETSWPLVSFGAVCGISLLAGTIGGACVSFSAWAMKKRGPVLVSMFSPIGTFCSVVLSFATLGDTINIGSGAGMFIMFTGLYLVLWAKGKEGYLNKGGLLSESDAEKPLLG
ncbi:WAT1-related protein At5g47470-like isoform X2 [Punica granatum]|uniref:WAT1-related protein n=2 Tax=Punica granatum TaxID=22663 RepID=A0A6P8EE92_PUNGR|nr:WAT1-related protein At5g47470-like isoform X2 [Punica granatum]